MSFVDASFSEMFMRVSGQDPVQVQASGRDEV